MSSMNIFYLSHNIDLCAQYHVNSHVNKMQTEMTQQMCIAIWVDRLIGFKPHKLEGEDYRIVRKAMEDARGLPKSAKIAPYATVQHINHPCSVWVRSSKNHFEYTRKLVIACENEHRFRMGHSSAWRHAACSVARSLITENMPYIGWKQLPRCIDQHNPDKYGTDTLQAYRTYYIRDKSHLHDWGKRGAPYWLSTTHNSFN